MTGPVSRPAWFISRMKPSIRSSTITERAGLAAVAVDGDRLALERLDDEIGDHAAVVGMHARAVGVENPRDPDVAGLLAVIVEEQRLGAALPLVVTGADADGIDVAPVGFRLRMNLRIAVNLAGRGLENPGPDPLGQAEHIDRAVDRGLGGLHRVVLVVDRRGGTGEIVDFIHLDI